MQKIFKHSDGLAFNAPAKINLYLHLNGRRDDGYHLIDSLVMFSDIADEILICASDKLSIEIDGPMKHMLKGQKQDHNIVYRAIIGLADIAGRAPHFNVKLTKNLPVAAGIGGGSANAAAVIRAVCDIWDVDFDAPVIRDFMLSVGADVPVCFYGEPVLMRGIGEILSPIHIAANIPVVLINPMVSCSTASVFNFYHRPFQDRIHMSQHFDCANALISFLKKQDNMLYFGARKVVPDVDNVLNALNAHNGCRLARMSGSGATCFGIFDTARDARLAAKDIQDDNPDWWVQAGFLKASSV